MAAVVPGLDAGPGDRDLGRGLHVDPVRVGAASRRDNLYVLHRDALAAVDHDVVQLAVDRGQAADHHVPRVQHLQRLATHQVDQEEHFIFVVSCMFALQHALARIRCM